MGKTQNDYETNEEAEKTAIWTNGEAKETTPEKYEVASILGVFRMY